MEWLSAYIIAAVAGYGLAQLFKYLVGSLKTRSLKGIRLMYLSGGMPSAHSASVVALLVVIGYHEGINSAVFGLALLFASVVMYDAMMVRRSSGEQGRALTELIKEQKSKVRLPRVAMGHTPLEVAVGALLGVVVGFVVAFTIA